jgi:Spy/CpxP family protein refolding chaperone
MDYFNKKRWAFWGVALLVIMNIASLATVWFQQHHRPEPFPPAGPPQDRMNAFLKHELELTEAQAEKLASLQREHFQQAKALHDRIRDLKHELFNELALDAPDTLQVERLAEAIGVQQRELEKAAFYHFLAFKRLCTPAQQKKLDRLFDELLRMMDPQRRPPPADARERPPRDG